MKKLRDVIEGSVMAAACVGIDLSLNGTGLAISIGGTIYRYYGWTNVIKTQKSNPEHISLYRMVDNSCDGNRIHRVITSVDWIMSIIHKLREDRAVVVGLEGYALSQKGNRVSDQHEQGGLLKAALWRDNIPYRIYTPSALKSAWTGKGNATKSQMQMTCYQLFGVDTTKFGDPGEDLADSILLAQLVCAELGLKQSQYFEDWPKSVRETLMKVPDMRKNPQAAGTNSLVQKWFVQRTAIPVSKPFYHNWNLD